ncbi:RNA-directed DNA polymerase, eukaryota, reverse transcriptase zinc-binding domain protein [Tanacetum coccineum]
MFINFMALIDSPLFINSLLSLKKNLKSTNDETQQDLEQHESVNSPSDDSCPPGFEYLKQTTTCHKVPASPKNTKCTTSFTKYCEREYKGQWLNRKGTYFMGKYVLFGDLNEVREESERFGSVYSTSEAQIFNSFIESSGLKEMLMGGKFFTWMNKSGTKMSRLNRFLISDEVLDENIDLKAILLDRLKDIGDVVKQAFADCSYDTVELRVPLHEVITLIKDIEIKLDASLASDTEKETRLQLLREINEIDRLESMDIVQKARKLSTQEKNDLECPVSSDEIKKAVWECDGDKAPGSGGFLFKFLKQYWEIFKFDMELFVSDFFTTLRMPPGTNSAFITLLPKVNNPTLIKDFRPISLISLQYKVTAKILANRLASVVHNIVSEEQSAFISGRQILDGPLMLSEIIDCLGLEKNGETGFKHAYNLLVLPFSSTRVKWENVLASLEKGGLGIGSLKAFNQAFLQKWRWRLNSNPKLLWVQLIKAIYGEDVGFVHLASTTKGVWANIMGSINQLHDCGIVPKDTLKYKVGCGTKMNWKRPIVSGRLIGLLEALQSELQHVTNFDGQDEIR